MNVNKILRFASIYYSIASAEELPENSKDLNVVLKNIEELETYQARKKYAEKNLKHLSSGSSRIVFLTKKDTVIKLAKNDKGIAQNKAESNLKGESKFVNKVLSHASDYSWIESQFLKKITEKQFQKMTGMDFDDFGECIRYALKSISGSKKEKPDSYKEISENPLFKELKDIAKKNHLLGGDIARISSFKTNGSYPILVDSGLTKKIFDKYYE
jgi:hypothetical protein